MAIQPYVTVSTLFSLALLPIVLLAIWLDPVTIVGVNGWIKPLKFLISTLIYAPSLMWLLMQVRGWRPLTGGDLRVPHFVGLHALQALPLIGWLLIRPRALRRWSEGQQVGLMWVAGLGYLSWMGLLTWQALQGESLVAPGLLTLSALSALLVATAGSALFVTRWPGRSSARA